MAITRDLSHLSRGCEPDEEPRFATVLVERWAKRNEEAGPKGHAVDGTRFRHSDAGKCSRLLAYKAAGIEQTDPMDLSGVWNTSIGTLLHDLWQEALREQYPDAEVELKVQAFVDGSGHIDAIIRHEGRVTVYELKTVGGYAFKAAIGKIRQGTPAEGPKLEHVTQAALGGRALDADEVVVGYLAKECLSANVARGMPEWARFVAEWTFPRAEYEPIANAEAHRVENIVALVDAGELAARKVPGVHGRIVDASRGRWELRDELDAIVDTGSYWGCNYCSHQALCALTEPGRIPVESAVELRKSLP